MHYIISFSVFLFAFNFVFVCWANSVRFLIFWKTCETRCAQAHHNLMKMTRDIIHSHPLIAREIKMCNKIDLLRFCAQFFLLLFLCFRCLHGGMMEQTKQILHSLFSFVVILFKLAQQKYSLFFVHQLLFQFVDSLFGAIAKQVFYAPFLH